MSINARERRRLARTRQLGAAQVKEGLKRLIARRLIELPEGAVLPDDPDAPLPPLTIRTPQETLDALRADPNVYKTPASNLIGMLDPAGAFDHWMTPDEAEAWQVDAEVLDEQNPGGTRA